VKTKSIDQRARECVEDIEKLDAFAESDTRWKEIRAADPRQKSLDHARPFDLAWARSLRDQCRAAGVLFFFKQAGARPYLGAQPAIDILHPKGSDLREVPQDLRVREFPEARA
jgi:hypothetical protein